MEELTLKLSKLVKFTDKYYSDKKMMHALRVASYSSDAALNHRYVDNVDAFLVGLAHDLIEDTDCPQDELEEILGPTLFTAVLDLTKTDEESYEEYIHRVLDTENSLVILVKRADMKDHLTQLDTLTDKLKNKYLPVLHYFL